MLKEAKEPEDSGTVGRSTTFGELSNHKCAISAPSDSSSFKLAKKMGYLNQNFFIVILVATNISQIISITSKASSYPKDFKRHSGPAPPTNWELGLKEAAHQALLRERIAQPHLRDNLLQAPIIGRENRASPFGDIAILARGQLLSTPAGFQFVQEPYQNDCIDCHQRRKCKNKECDIYNSRSRTDEIMALWTVKRIRHRDADVGHRFELEYTISPLNAKRRQAFVLSNGNFDYAIPGHVFVVKTNPEGGAQNNFKVFGHDKDRYVTNADRTSQWLVNQDVQQYPAVGYNPPIPPPPPPPPPFNDFYPKPIQSTGIYIPDNQLFHKPPHQHIHFPHNDNKHILPIGNELQRPHKYPTKPQNHYLPQSVQHTPHPQQTSPQPTQGTQDYYTISHAKEVELYKNLIQSLSQKTSTTHVVAPSKHDHRFGRPTKITPTITQTISLEPGNGKTTQSTYYQKPIQTTHQTSTKSSLKPSTTIFQTTFHQEPTSFNQIPTQTTFYQTPPQPIFQPTQPQTSPQTTLQQTTLHHTPPQPTFQQTSPQTTFQHTPQQPIFQKTTPQTFQHTPPQTTFQQTHTQSTYYQTPTQTTIQHIPTQESGAAFSEGVSTITQQKPTTIQKPQQTSTTFVPIQPPYIQVPTSSLTPENIATQHVDFTPPTLPHRTTIFIPEETPESTKFTTGQTYETTKQSTSYVTSQETQPPTSDIAAQEQGLYPPEKTTFIVPYTTTEQIYEVSQFPHTNNLGTEHFETTRPNLETTRPNFETSRPIPTFYIDPTHPGYPKTTPTTPFTEYYGNKPVQSTGNQFPGSTVFVQFEPGTTYHSTLPTKPTSNQAPTSSAAGTTIRFPGNTDRYIPESTPHFIHIPTIPQNLNTPFQQPSIFDTFHKKPHAEEYDDYLDLFPSDKNVKKTTTENPNYTTLSPKSTEGFLLHDDEYYPKKKDKNKTSDEEIFDKVTTTQSISDDVELIMPQTVNTKEIDEVFENATHKPAVKITEDFDDFFLDTSKSNQYTESTTQPIKIIYSDFFVASTANPTSNLEASNLSTITGEMAKPTKAMDQRTTTSAQITNEGSTSQSYSTSVSFEVHKRNKTGKPPKKIKHRKAKVLETNLDSKDSVYKVEQLEKKEQGPETTTNDENRANQAFDDLALSLVNHARSIDYLENKNKKPKYRRKAYGRVRKVRKQVEK